MNFFHIIFNKIITVFTAVIFGTASISIPTPNTSLKPVLPPITISQPQQIKSLQRGNQEKIKEPFISPIQGVASQALPKKSNDKSGSISSPQIISIDPTIIVNTYNNIIKINGSGFQDGAVVQIGNQYFGLTDKIKPNPQASAVFIAVPVGFMSGTYRIVVSNLDGGSSVMNSALTVTSSNTPSIIQGEPTTQSQTSSQNQQNIAPVSIPSSPITENLVEVDPSQFKQPDPFWNIRSEPLSGSAASISLNIETEKNDKAEFLLNGKIYNPSDESVSAFTRTLDYFVDGLEPDTVYAYALKIQRGNQYAIKRGTFKTSSAVHCSGLGSGGVSPYPIWTGVITCSYSSNDVPVEIKSLKIRINNFSSTPFSYSLLFKDAGNKLLETTLNSEEYTYAYASPAQRYRIDKAVDVPVSIVLDKNSPNYNNLTLRVSYDGALANTYNLPQLESYIFIRNGKEYIGKP